MRLIVCLALLAFVSGYALSLTYDEGVASAQGSGSQVAPAPVGSGSSASVPDPVQDPSGFYAEMMQLKKKGWLGFVLVLLYGAMRVLGYLGKNVKILAPLASGFVSMAIAAVGTTVTAGIDVLFLGGGTSSIMMAMLMALIGFISPAAKSKEA